MIFSLVYKFMKSKGFLVSLVLGVLAPIPYYYEEWDFDGTFKDDFALEILKSSVDNGVFEVLLPILVCLPAASALANFSSNKYEYIVKARVGNRQYLRDVLIANAIVSFSVTFILMSLFTVLSIVISGDIDDHSSIEFMRKAYYFLSPFADNTILFGLVWGLHMAFCSVAISTFSAAIGFLFENKYLALAGGFILAMAGDIIAPAIGISSYDYIHVIEGWASTLPDYLVILTIVTLVLLSGFLIAFYKARGK